MRFLGNIEAKIDAKGRAFLPATFRKILQAAGEEGLVLRKDVFQSCLVLYPESVWNEQMDAMRQRLNRWNKQQQQVFRQFVSEVELITLDGNGRFLIPKRYQRMAAIEQDIKFVGMDDTIEIWGLQKAEEQQMSPEDFNSAGRTDGSDRIIKKQDKWSRRQRHITYQCSSKRASTDLTSSPTASTWMSPLVAAVIAARFSPRLGKNGHLYSFDQDADAEKNIIADDRFTFVRSNFRYLRNWMRYYGVEAIDGLLADLGVSSHHFDDETRGFSFRFDAPLDMRMNKRAGKTAADIVNEYDEAKLADVFFLYGELKNSRRIANAIAAYRQQKRIETTGDLMAATEKLMRTEKEKKDLARLFQALRIEVNHEMDALRDMLNSASQLLKNGGRLSVITYHSLEDRIVKNVMKAGNAEGKIEKDFFGRVSSPFRLVNNKVITPQEDELQNNPRSRSAKLRIAERI